MQERFPLTLFTPVRNAEAYFERTLESVAAQTSKNFEYIVLDAASTDGTAAFIEKYRSVISYTHSRSDAGAVDAFNTGIEMAQGRFIAFLSADDWIEPDMAERIELAAKAHPDADILSFGMNEWQDRPGTPLSLLATYLDPDDGVFDVQNALYSPCVSRCFSRALYKRYGVYRHAEYGYFSDRELQLRFALEHPSKIVIPKVLYHFRKHAASATGNAGVGTIIKSMECNMKIADRYLRLRTLDPVQKKALLKWYGFAWIRNAFFRAKARHVVKTIKVVLQGALSHPVACFYVLFSSDIPPAYRPTHAPQSRGS